MDKNYIILSVILIITLEILAIIFYKLGVKIKAKKARKVPLEKPQPKIVKEPPPKIEKERPKEPKLVKPEVPLPKKEVKIERERPKEPKLVKPEVPLPKKEVKIEKERPKEPKLVKPEVPLLKKEVKVKPPQVVIPKKPLKEGLAKTHRGFVLRLFKVLKGKKELSPQLLEEIEEVLFTADIGVRTSQYLLDTLQEKLSRQELQDPEKVWDFLKEESYSILNIECDPISFSSKPFVIMVVGVNGVGKTTTIGKLASKYKNMGQKVILVAADTFRAAAVEQLDIWAKRVECEMVRGKEKADPSSVIFDGIKKAQAQGVDIVIADTAGRLHTKIPLMEELKKIKRVIKKSTVNGPHEIFLVLDATCGQNAIQQAHMFHNALGITGFILTKLDGTAKGGVILGVCNELQIPVRYIGIGEKIEDLREFNALEFTEALFLQKRDVSLAA
jgi:fused signal recognition particle receptor